jgi:putative iron-regulated protein
VHGSYTASLADASALQTAIDTLVGDPVEANYETARTAWLDARESYGPTEVYRFYDGPIDIEPGGPEGQLNAWPMDENFVDYVEGDDMAGVINDTAQDITAAALEGLNGANDAEENVATGYHAIEFLLWGQDLSADGPGSRPHTDYVTDGSGTAANQDRRGLYLQTAAGIVVADLEMLVGEWSDSGGNYRASFVAEGPEEIVRRIMLGMGSLSGAELAGERMEVALLSGEQEDEHSCFSDNTHRDIYLNQLGIQQALQAGIDDLIAARNPDLAAELSALSQQILDDMDAVPAPFDQALSTHNAELTQVVADLRTQADLIQQGAAAMGITLNLE